MKQSINWVIDKRISLVLNIVSMINIGVYSLRTKLVIRRTAFRSVLAKSLRSPVRFIFWHSLTICAIVWLGWPKLRIYVGRRFHLYKRSPHLLPVVYIRFNIVHIVWVRCGRGHSVLGYSFCQEFILSILSVSHKGV